MAEAFGIACHKLVSLDFRCGSTTDSRDPLLPRPLSEVEQTKSARKPTQASNVGHQRSNVAPGKGWCVFGAL